MFNVEQADGLELKPREGQARPEWDAHRDAEKVIEAPGLPGRTSTGRELLRGLGSQSAPIRRRQREDGRAVVDGLCQELDGSDGGTGRNPSTSVPLSNRQQPASGSWSIRAECWSMTSRRCGCSKRGKRLSF